MDQVRMNRFIWIGLFFIVSAVASSAFAAKSVNYYVNQVNNKVRDIDRAVKKEDFASNDGEKNYAMVMKTLNKLEVQCDKIKDAFKLNDPKTYDFKSVERARGNVQDLKASVAAKYKRDKASAVNLEMAMGDSTLDPDSNVNRLYDRYENFKPKLNVKKSKKNPNASMDQVQQVLVEVNDRLDSFEADKKFIVALSADTKWKNHSKVKRLHMGFTSNNKSYNYKMKLDAMQKKIIGGLDVTQTSSWKRHVASLNETPEQMYAKWKQNTPSLVKQVERIKAQNDAYADLMGKDEKWLEVNQTYVKLKSLADKTYSIYMESVRAPKDAYQGRDREHLKRGIKEKWMSLHKRDNILDVRLPAEQWKQNVSVDVSDAGTYLLKIERRHLEKMPLAVIVKGPADRAVIYWGGIYKNKMDGGLHYAVNDKSGRSGFVVEEMLAKNLK